MALKGEAIGLAVDDRAAARDRRHPARRPVDRAADEDRAGRPAAGDVRPQRRGAGAGDRRPRRRRDCFECAIEACRIARQVHDAGDPALRRLHRERRRAVAAARRSRTCRAFPVQFRTDPEGFLPVRARRRRRSRGRGSCRARRASSTASAASRRQDVTGNISYDAEQPRAHGAAARGEGGGDRATTIPDAEVPVGDPTASCWSSAGARPTARSRGARRAAARAGPPARPRAPAPPQPAAAGPRRDLRSASSASWSPS